MRKLLLQTCEEAPEAADPSQILLGEAPDRLGYRGFVDPAGAFGELTVGHYGILFCEQKDDVSAPVSSAIGVILPPLALVLTD